MTAIETAIRIVVDLLVRGEYETIERLDRGGRISATDLARAVDDYGRTLSPVPPDWWQTVTVTPIAGSAGRAVHAAAPLWTLEEGRSDLTLELQLVEIAPEAYETSLLDLHVL